MFMTLRKAKLVFLGVAASQLPVFLSMCWNEALAAEPVGTAKNAYKEKKIEMKAGDVQKGRTGDVQKGKTSDVQKGKTGDVQKSVEKKTVEKSVGKETGRNASAVSKQDSKPGSAAEKVPSAKTAKATAAAYKNASAKLEGKGEQKAESKSEQKAEAKGDKKSDKARKAREAVLVPPPPPATPSFLPDQLSDLGDIGPLEFLSKDDLKFKLENLNKKLAAAKADQKDQEELTKEIKGKAERFDSLFAEGVVSKRELESSKKEAERSERDLERTNIKVAEYQRMTETVQERLTKVEAASKPKAVKPIAGKAAPVRKKKTALGRKISN